METRDILQKQLLTATLEDLVEALKPLLGNDANSHTGTKASNKKYVYGVRGLAKLLNCSVATAQRRISSGSLDNCIIRSGRIIVIDSEAALDVLKGGAR